MANLNLHDKGLFLNDGVTEPFVNSDRLAIDVQLLCKSTFLAILFNKTF